MAANRILIVGGGIGGLALAQGLKKHGLPFTVFERDASPESRAQGYRIKVFPDTVADLKYVLSDELWAEFEATCAETGMGETTLSVHDGSILANRVSRGPKPYTVDRSCLRKVLMHGLESDLRWNCAFVRYETAGDHVLAHFADGSVERGALLVGVDGWRSPVRRQYLPNHQVIDTEGCVVFGKTFITPELERRFPASAMKWMTLSRDIPPCIQEVLLGNLPITFLTEVLRFPGRDSRADLPPDYVYWAMLIPKRLLAPSDELLATVLAQPAKDLALLMSSEWHPSIRSVLELQDAAQSSALRIFSAPPTIAAWTPSAQVTLMGDAIHQLSPAGGVGAVTAIKDAATLTQALVEQGLSRAAVGAYETAMRAYASANIQRSFSGANKLYGMPPFEKCQVVEP